MALVSFTTPSIGTNYYNVNQAAGDGRQRVDFVINNTSSQNPYSYNNGPIPDIANCVLWLRSDLGITLSAGGVNTWNDQSGSNNNGSQTSSGKQPTFVANDSKYNYQHSFSFSSASSQDIPLTSLFPQQPFTAYVVGNFGSGTSQQQFFGDSSTNLCIYFIGPSTQPITAYAGSTISSGNTTLSPIAVCAVYNKTNSALYVNSSANPTLGSIGNGEPAGNEAIGNQGATGGEYLNGKITEIVVYNTTHTSVQVNMMFNYFAMRYGIASS